MVKLEEAKVILEDLSLVYEQQSILMPEYKKSYLSNKEAIETVLQELENSIPKKIIEDKLLYLMEQLGEADLGDFYDEVRDIKEELLM